MLNKYINTYNPPSVQWAAKDRLQATVDRKGVVLDPEKKLYLSKIAKQEFPILASRWNIVDSD